MLDIKPDIARKLSAYAEVRLAFPKTEAKTPLIVISENENVTKAVLSGTERFSSVTLQLDVYGAEAGETEELAALVSGEMTASGFKRIYSSLFTEGRTPRRCMRFRGVIDTCNGKVYSGNN